MKPIPSHELVGARVVGELPSADMVDLWGRISSGHRQVRVRDRVPRPRTAADRHLRRPADHDRPRRRVRDAVLPAAASVRTLGAVGGAVAGAARSGELQHTSDRSRFMQVLHDYEFEAARFGMQLMHERGVTGLDQWYSDFVETDWRYVERFYETDRIPPWTDCIVERLPADSAGADSAAGAPAGRGPVRVLTANEATSVANSSGLVIRPR